MIPVWRFGCLAVLVGLFVAEVTELTKDNFDATLKGNVHVIVDFYAPWCGHCKALAPEFDKASEDFEGRVVFAKVDATEETDLAEYYHVEGYPTLYFFRNARAEPYTGGRDKSGIAQWVEDTLGPAMKTVQESELEALLGQRKVMPYFVARGGHDLSGIFGRIAERHRIFGAFFFVAQEASESPFVQIHRGIDDVVDLNGPSATSDEAVERFILDELLPPFGEINEDNFEGYLSRPGSEGILWACFTPETFREEARQHQAAFKEAAHHFRQLFFVFTDTKEYEEHVREELGCREYPTLVLQTGNISDPESLRRFKQKFKDNELTPASIKAWVQDVLDGKVQESDSLDELDEDEDEEFIDGRSDPVVGEKQEL